MKKENGQNNWIKIALVGDERVGKTCLVKAFAERRPPGGNEPKIYPLYTTQITFNNKPHTLALCDTEGINDLSHLNSDVDLVLICFSVIVPISLDNVRLKWLPDIQRFCQGKPFLLVGTQVDIREDPTIMESMRRFGTIPISKEVGVSIAEEIGAVEYVECSSHQIAGVKRLFDDVIGVCMARAPKIKKSRSIFGGLLKSPRPSKKTSLPSTYDVAYNNTQPPPVPTKRREKHRSSSTDLPDAPVLLREPSTSQSTLDRPITPSKSFRSSINTSSDIYPPRDRGLPSDWIIEDPLLDEIPPTPSSLPIIHPPTPRFDEIELASSVPTYMEENIIPHAATNPGNCGYDFATLYRSTQRELPMRDQPLDWTGYVQKLGDYAVGGGNYGDVWQGGWINLPHGIRPAPLVAVKVIRPLAIYQQDGGKKAFKHLGQEIAVWHALDHENIVPFIGVCSNFGVFPALISLWMPNGTAKDYLQTHPEADRHAFNLGIARGLEHLHTRNPEIVHGDLKAVNILVDENEQPRLSDFGLSRIVLEATLWATTSSQARGTTRWMAPELLLGHERRVNRASDVYAYAMTSLEVLTGRVPFHYLPNDPRVMMALANKERPRRPVEEVRDVMWHLLQECWSELPILRPTIGEVVSRLNRMMH